MIRMIDNTLTALDHNLPSKEDLHKFSEMLFMIGIDVVELSVAAYERMEYLPPDRKFMLNINLVEDMKSYPGFYRYVCRQKGTYDKLVYEIQINDLREIVRLRTLQDYKEIRITGLDDLLCHDSYEKVLEEIKRYLPNNTVILCPENTFGCASAMAMQWAADYGSNITSSYAGCKHNAASEQVIMALRLTIRHKPNRDLSVLPSMTELYEQITGNKINNKQPIIGRNIFQVEAGIHVDGIRKNPATYEAYQPSLVGGKTELILGKHSGKKAIILKLEELGFPTPDENVIDRLLNQVKSISTYNRKSLNDAEFVQIVKEVLQFDGNETHCRYYTSGWGTKSPHCSAG